MPATRQEIHDAVQKAIAWSLTHQPYCLAIGDVQRALIEKEMRRGQIKRWRRWWRGMRRARLERIRANKARRLRLWKGPKYLFLEPFGIVDGVCAQALNRWYDEISAAPILVTERKPRSGR